MEKSDFSQQKKKDFQGEELLSYHSVPFDNPQWRYVRKNVLIEGEKKVSYRFSLIWLNGEKCGRTVEMEEEIRISGLDPYGNVSPPGDCNFRFNGVNIQSKYLDKV